MKNNSYNVQHFPMNRAFEVMCNFNLWLTISTSYNQNTVDETKQIIFTCPYFYSHAFFVSVEG